MTIGLSRDGREHRSWPNTTSCRGWGIDNLRKNDIFVGMTSGPKVNV